MKQIKTGFKKTVVGASWLTISSVVARFLTPVSTAILARLLDSADFGLISMASVFISAAELFRDMGVGKALIAYEGDIRKASNTAFFFFLGVGVIAVAALWGLSYFAEIIFNEESLSLIIKVLALSFFIHAISAVPQLLIQREGKWKMFAVFDIIPSLLVPASTVVFALAGFGVWSIVFGNIIGQFLKLIIILLIYPWRPRFEFSWKIAKKLVNYGIWILIDRICTFLFTTADKTYLMYFKGKAMLGYYTLPFTWITYPIRYILYKINRTMFPTLSGIDDLEVQKEVFFKVTRLVCFLISPIYLYLIFNAEIFVLTVFSEKWRFSIEVIRLLAVYGILRSLTASLFGSFFWSTRRPILAVYPQIYSLIFISVGFIITGGKLDAIFVAMLFCFAVILRGIMGLFILNEYYKIKFSKIIFILMSGIFPAGISSFLTMLVVNYLPVSVFIKFLISIIVFGNVYFIVYSIFKYKNPFALHKPGTWKKILKDFKKK